MKKIIALTLSALFILSACSGNSETSEDKENEQVVDVSTLTYEEILENANGQTVSFYLWGGNVDINNFIDGEITDRAKEYGITINRVPLSNPSESVSLVSGEKQAGKDYGGSADLFWINGPNFLALKEADLLYTNWAENIPNAVDYVDFSDYSISHDMGVPVEGDESPWMTAQMQIIYDSSKINEEDLPRTYAELLEYAKENPGRFTFPGAPDFTGTRFLKGALYEFCGGHETFAKEGITEEEFNVIAEPLKEWLFEISPYLWREGETFPQSDSAMFPLLSNGEIDFALTLNGMGISALIDNGMLPETAKVYTLDTSISDTNYVSIPYNSSNKEASIVVANLLLDPEIQAMNIEETAGAPAISYEKLDEEQKKRFDEALGTLREGSYVTDEEKAKTRAPEVSSYLNPYIENIFYSHISG